MEELYQRYGDNLTKELRVILSDIEMPQMDGYRFASTIKNDERFLILLDPKGLKELFNTIDPNQNILK